MKEVIKLAIEYKFRSIFQKHGLRNVMKATIMPQIFDLFSWSGLKHHHYIFKWRLTGKREREGERHAAKVVMRPEPICGMRPDH